MVKFGAMNNPSKPIADEIEWIGSNGFDFVDLTIEPTQAYFEQIEEMGGTGEIKRLLYRYGMDCVGHTAFFLPFCVPFKSLRDAAVAEAAKAAIVFSRLKAKYMTIHLNKPATKLLWENNSTFDWAVESMIRLSEMTKTNGINIMIETAENSYWNLDRIAELLYKVPELRYHLDVGHFFVVNHGHIENLGDLLDKLKNKLVHVHMHDNDGTDDQHLPIGAGRIDWEKVVHALRDIGYDDTITIELHTPEKEFFKMGRDKIKKLWMQF